MKRVAPFSTEILALSIQFLSEVLFRIFELLITWSRVLRSALPPQRLTVLLTLSYFTHVLLLDTRDSGKDNGEEELGIILSEGTGELAIDVSFSRCCMPPLLTLVLFPIPFVSLLVSLISLRAWVSRGLAKTMDRKLSIAINSSIIMIATKKNEKKSVQRNTLSIEINSL